MVAIGFFTLVAMAILGIAFNIIVRVRLMKRDTARDRIAWLSRGSAEAWDTYDALFPGSLMTRFLRAMFWVVIAFAAVLLAVGLLMRR